jgi:hypothetical protein
MRERDTTPESGSDGPDDSFRELVGGSGNTFHCRVATYFRNAGWQVLLSPYYVDNATGRTREVDLLCERLWEFRDPHNRSVSRLLRMQLLVECKYIPQDTSTVFWFDEGDRIQTRELVVASVPRLKGQSPINEHHYYTVRTPGVAKLFASDCGRGEEKEPIFMALNQSLGALIQLAGFPPLTTQQATEVEFTIAPRYPVIVCSNFDRFRRTDLKGADPTQLDDNFVMEVNYAFTNSANRPIQKYALIDVISWRRIDQFLRDLDTEAEAVRLVSGF